MKTRVGFGFDVHRLVEGRELWLGGIRIDHSLGLLGHSDADVLIHALCDALLGAANMRDIGYHFPDTAGAPTSPSVPNAPNSTPISRPCNRRWPTAWASTPTTSRSRLPPPNAWASRAVKRVSRPMPSYFSKNKRRENRCQTVPSSTLCIKPKQSYRHTNYDPISSSHTVSVYALLQKKQTENFPFLL